MVNPLKEYAGYFDNWGDVVREFALLPEDEEPQAVFAVYDCESYEGSASVVFVTDGVMYEVHGSHCSCSCYGLEGQWEPEAVDPKILVERQKRSTYGELHANKDAFLTWLEAVDLHGLVLKIGA